MEGQLSEHPLAELISEILEKRFSGALRVARERVKAALYFAAGELTYATSNLHSLRLSEYLKKRGLAPPTTDAKDLRSDFAIADELVSRGVLPRPVLDEALAEQVTDVVRVLSLWTSGEWIFDGRARLTEPTLVRVQIKQLLLDAARQMDLRFTSSRIRSPVEVISPASDGLGDLILSPTEGFLVSRVETPIAVGELIMLSGLREPEAHRTIYGLVLAGVLNRELPPRAFRDGEQPTTTKTPKKAAPGIAAPAEPTHKGKPAPVRDAQQELKAFLDQLANATNHYQVLNVPLAADASEAKRAYYSLARHFHPDRFHDLARTPIHARLEAAFARITQAHETLSNPDLKAAYDLKISAQQRADNSAGNSRVSVKPPAEPSDGADELQIAEKRFQDGVAALQINQTNIAISCLSAAVRMAPNKARYRAYYGRALATNEQTQRLAEAELQAAVKLDPNNPSYHLMLAGLYRSLGFSRRAIAELERVLSLDPQNAEARKLLQALGVKKR
jgi:tetratricopeptide (TPR) repeat protein